MIILDYTLPPLVGQDISATYRMMIHRDSPDISNDILDWVVQRTPIMTGALQSSYVAEPHPDPSDPIIAYVHSTDGPQLDQWGRVYVQYVEGGALGLPTWTNPPREMFARTAVIDLPEVVQWAEEKMQEAVDAVVAGNGVPL